MHIQHTNLLRSTVALLALFLVACGGGSASSGTSGPAPTYSIGGTLTGLLSTNSITLVNNGTDVLTLNGASNVNQTQTFAFATKLNYGASYGVAVSGVAPASQPCASTYGAGMLAYADNVPGYYLPGVNLFCGLTGGANAFTQSANLMNAARYNHTATLLQNGQVLVVDGQGASNTALASAELYAPNSGATGTWAATTNHPSVLRYSHAATLLPSGKVLVSGGKGTDSTSAELYDPNSGTWRTTTNSMSEPRYSHTATLLPSGKVLVSGGYNTLMVGATAGTELYDPATGSWTSTGPMNVPRHNHTATLLPNGKVLVAGGTGTVTAPSSAELYDPATGIWLNTCNLTTGRYNHTATLLPNGKVLVSGGQLISAIVTGTAELYDPATACSGTSSNWTNTGSLTTARYNHTVTLLQNGKVLVSGGNNGTAALDSFELYY